MIPLQIIIYDLETTYTYQKGQIPEVVEIGAVKIDPDLRQIVDSFQCYVFPEIRGRFDKRTRSFIGMSVEEVENAISFQQSIHALLEWMGDDYYFCAWGPDDKRILLEHCIRFGMSYDWLKNTNNVQTGISKLLGPNNQMGLSKALDIANIKVEGRLHSAIVDAINTAKLFLLYFDQVPLETNQPPSFVGESCSLVRVCRSCKKEKSYRQFRLRKGYCRRCESRWRATHHVSQSPQ